MKQTLVLHDPLYTLCIMLAGCKRGTKSCHGRVGDACGDGAGLKCRRGLICVVPLSSPLDNKSEALGVCSKVASIGQVQLNTGFVCMCSIWKPKSGAEVHTT